MNPKELMPTAHRASLFLLVTIGSLSPVVSAQAGYFTNTGPANFSLSFAKATGLRDGRVLVTGTNAPSAVASIYEPATMQWRGVTNMQSSRFLHTATLLADGRVLAVGGNTATAELFDPTTETWVRTSSLYLIWKHTATLLPSGKVLIAGGANGTSGEYATAMLYDPATGKFVATAPMGTPRARHTATLLQDGRVLVAGGYSNDVFVASAEIYDPEAGTWAPTGPMLTGRRLHTATLLSNGKVLIAGGEISTSPVGLRSAEIYDPSSGAWRSTGSLNTNRLYHAATLLPSGKVLVTGGQREENSPYYVLMGEIYDPETEAWEWTGQMSSLCTQHAATLLNNGQVLAAGDLYIEAAPFRILNTSRLPDGRVALTFTNTPGAKFDVLGSSPFPPSVGDWTLLGTPSEASPGYFEFVDVTATNAMRFHRVRSK